MSSLVRKTQNELMHSDSVSGTVGKGLVFAGASFIPLYFPVSLVPFVGPVMGALILMGLGAMLWE